jgi:diaminopimelate decarboxylase
MSMPNSPSPVTRLDLFPITTRVAKRDNHTELTIDDQSLTDLAAQYGTPLYIYDQATLDQCLEEYLQALIYHYPGSSGITYAGKAFLCLAMAQWVRQRDIFLDCSSAGELYIAAQAGVPRNQLVAHGVNKSPIDLRAAIQNASRLVVDNLEELDRLKAIIFEQQTLGELPFPTIWLRFRPGVDVQTHAHIQTGQTDSKFGLSGDEFIRGVITCLETGLPLDGLHFHLGSHIHTPEPLILAIQTTMVLVEACFQKTGWMPGVICIGGGWGVPYHEGDLPHQSIEHLVKVVALAFEAGCQARGLPLFHLQLEPGRSLVARAGVAIYRIGSVKQTSSRCYLLLDGGLADNPRPALYQAQYSALPVRDPLRQLTKPGWLAGPFCESSDILIENLPLPELTTGDLVAVPVSGAYQLSMSSNYNGACRPAVLWLANHQAALIQTRETATNLVSRDRPLPIAGTNTKLG